MQLLNSASSAHQNTGSAFSTHPGERRPDRLSSFSIRVQHTSCSPSTRSSCTGRGLAAHLAYSNAGGQKQTQLLRASASPSARPTAVARPPLVPSLCSTRPFSCLAAAYLRAHEASRKTQQGEGESAGRSDTRPDHPDRPLPCTAPHALHTANPRTYAPLHTSVTNKHHLLVLLHTRHTRTERERA